MRRTVKYLVEHGEIWLDLDGSEPEWGVIVVNVTSGTLARILDVPEAKVRAVVGDGIFIVTYLTERMRVARTYFTVRDPAGDLVGPGCPFELRLYPPPVIGGE
ncbi:MAG TPA: hypothetical protein EYP43_04260 [Thermoplasmata archaeon]|nr:hypothetical protein [Thermoplasmata archaeon]